MLLATEASARWRRRAFAGLLAIGVSFLYYRLTAPFLHGGSAFGLGYGALGLLLLIVLALLGARRRRYRSTLGTVEDWTQSHVYLGLVATVVVLLHSGFRFEDRLAVTALLVLLAVAGSGAAGAVLYTFLPRPLSEAEANLFLPEAFDQLSELRRAMTRVAAGKSEAFQTIYRDLLRESTPPRLAGWRILLRPDDPRPGTAGWESRLPQIAPSEEGDLKRLLVFSRQHQELHQRLISRQRLKNLMEVWLYLHVPLTFALLVLVSAHLIAALYFS